MPDTEPANPPAIGFIAWRNWLLVLALGLGLIALFMELAGNRPEQAGEPAAQVPGSAIGGPFTLTAPDGSTVSDRTLAGKPFAIFFGFTRCPDVCPTSLARMARLRQQLGPDGMKFAIVFVSVDPGHDTPADLGSYVALFDTPIIGLTGSEAGIEQIKKRYGVFSARVPQPGGDYTIDHTAAIYLMTATGAFSGTIDFRESDAAALAKLRRLIA